MYSEIVVGLANGKDKIKKELVQLIVSKDRVQPVDLISLYCNWIVLDNKMDLRFWPQERALWADRLHPLVGINFITVRKIWVWK